MGRRICPRKQSFSQKPGTKNPFSQKPGKKNLAGNLIGQKKVKFMDLMIGLKISKFKKGKT